MIQYSHEKFAVKNLLKSYTTVLSINLYVYIVLKILVKDWRTHNVLTVLTDLKYQESSSLSVCHIFNNDMFVSMHLQHCLVA